MTIKSLQIRFPEDDVADLKSRLMRTRLPDPMPGCDWQGGTDGQYLRQLLDYWARDYDWYQRQELLNRHSHFVADIDGVGIHFIHARSSASGAIPLLLLHGWPSSFIQMLDIIPWLTAERADGMPSFHVVAASLPGYPFTHVPEWRGMHFEKMAALMVKLMVEKLGYPRFAGRGSDQGGLVLQQIGLGFPQRLVGLHRSGITPFLNPLPEDLSPAETEYQQKVAQWALQETAYARLQSQRPETLIPALTDSPAGMASWFLEKFQRWGDTREGLDATFGRDKLLDNLTLHWLCKSAAYATRLYRESALHPGALGKVQVPTAIMMPLRDGITVPAPRAWCERSYNVKRWTILENGGHFPEWEVPDAVADDMRQFFADIA